MISRLFSLVFVSVCFEVHDDDDDDKLLEDCGDCSAGPSNISLNLLDIH